MIPTDSGVVHQFFVHQFFVHLSTVVSVVWYQIPVMPPWIFIWVISRILTRRYLVMVLRNSSTSTQCRDWSVPPLLQILSACHEAHWHGTHHWKTRYAEFELGTTILSSLCIGGHTFRLGCPDLLSYAVSWPRCAMVTCPSSSPLVPPAHELASPCSAAVSTIDPRSQPSIILKKGSSIREVADYIKEIHQSGGGQWESRFWKGVAGALTLFSPCSVVPWTHFHCCRRKKLALLVKEVRLEEAELMLRTGRDFSFLTLEWKVVRYNSRWKEGMQVKILILNF